MLRKVNITGNDQLRAIRLDQLEGELNDKLSVSNVSVRSINSRYVYIEFDTQDEVSDDDVMSVWRTHTPEDLQTVTTALDEASTDEEKLNVLITIINSKYGYEVFTK